MYRNCAYLVISIFHLGKPHLKKYAIIEFWFYQFISSLTIVKYMCVRECDVTQDLSKGTGREQEKISFNVFGI